MEQQKEIKSVAEEDALRKLLASDEEDNDEEQTDKKESEEDKNDDEEGKEKDDKVRSYCCVPFIDTLHLTGNYHFVLTKIGYFRKFSNANLCGQLMRRRFVIKFAANLRAVYHYRRLVNLLAGELLSQIYVSVKILQLLSKIF